EADPPAITAASPHRRWPVRPGPVPAPTVSDAVCVMPQSEPRLATPKAQAPAERGGGGVMCPVGVLDDGVLPQPGLAQPALQALVLARGRLSIDQQTEPVLA